MRRRRALLSILIDSDIGTNEIWYTTSDNAILTASSNSTFSTGLVSNTYAGGKGVLRYSTPLTTLPLNMFRGCTNLTSVTMPSSITTWENYTFHSTGLTSMEIPEGVTTIGNEIFSGCTSLTNVIFSNSVTNIGTYTFLNCTALQTVQLPQSLQKISNYMFKGCTRLTKIEIPNSVTTIGGYAFENCSGLTSITIPKNAKSMGSYVFKGCRGLASIVVENGNTGYDSRNNCNAIIKTSTNTLIAGCKNTIIPENVTSIGSSAFYNLIGFISIEIPNSVTSIGEDAFRGCTDLTSVTIGSKVTSIGGSAFYGCWNITSIEIPASVTSIGVNAFYGCTDIETVHISDLAAWCNIDFSNQSANPVSESLNLYLNNTLITSLVIPNGITTIKHNAFCYCKSLTSVIIPNSVTSIEFLAFICCDNLTSIVVPDNVTTIESYAFSSKLSGTLLDITIGSGVTSIGNNVFAYQTKLSAIYCKATTPPTVTSSTFANVPTTAVIYVPTSAVSAYQASAGWGEFTIQGHNF